MVRPAGVEPAAFRFGGYYRTRHQAKASDSIREQRRKV